MIEQALGPLMVDLRGVSLTPAERALLVSPAVGAVILFSRNYASKPQLTALVAEIKRLRNPSLLVAVDQEGGRVQRFKHGFSRLPAAMKFGVLFDRQPDHACELAYQVGALMAFELRQVGVDFSFAPVLDHANQDSRVIADRCFHRQGDVICRLAGAFVDGMAFAGMCAIGKHFPGHGGVAGDSHLETPVDERGWEELVARDLVPFRRLGDKLGGIMTAHVLFARICAEVPTFSAHWIRQVLRRQLGFRGVVFSDDLMMQGAQTSGDSVAQRSLSALRAGCDLLLICNAPAQAVAAAQRLRAGFIPDRDALERLRLRADGAMNEQHAAGFKARLTAVWG